MNPWDDERLRAIVGYRPAGGDWSWCEECLRWEYTGDTRHGIRKHTRPELHWRARVLDWFAERILSLWMRVSTAGTLSQARYLVRSGQGESWGNKPPRLQ